jgi:hypothetical protein
MAQALAKNMTFKSLKSMVCQMLCEELKGRFRVVLSEDCIWLAPEVIPDHLEETHRSL